MVLTANISKGVYTRWLSGKPGRVKPVNWVYFGSPFKQLPSRSKAKLKMKGRWNWGGCKQQRGKCMCKKKKNITSQKLADIYPYATHTHSESAILFQLPLKHAVMPHHQAPCRNGHNIAGWKRVHCKETILSPEIVTLSMDPCYSSQYSRT